MSYSRTLNFSDTFFQHFYTFIKIIKIQVWVGRPQAEKKTEAVGPEGGVGMRCVQGFTPSYF